MGNCKMYKEWAMYKCRVSTISSFAQAEFPEYLTGDLKKNLTNDKSRTYGENFCVHMEDDQKGFC